MKRILSFLLILTLLLTASSCKKAAKSTKDNVKDVQAVVSPEYPKSIAFNDYDARRDNIKKNPMNDDFTAALKSFSYNSVSLLLSKSDGNANYSPLSLYFALALAGSGADGTTEEEFLKLFGIASMDELVSQSGNLYRRLYTDNKISKLKIANSLWLDKNTEFQNAYKKNAADNFYSSLFNVNFQEASAKSAMSKWISDNTNGKITPEIEFSDQQIMSILNTVYFYDEWISRFDENKTAEDKFYPSSDKDVTCDFMNATFSSHSFYDGEGYMRSGLDLKNHNQMIFVLPDLGSSVKELLSSKDKIAEIFDTEDDRSGKVIFKIPKFSFDCTYELKDAIKALGIKSAFTENADFSKITDGTAYISDIKQQTHIAINEIGVEAAAFTQINYAGAAMPTDTAEMILNRPFIYGITSYDGTLLFIGVCENPKKTSN